MKEKVCKYCKDEICVNDQCPMRADYCPVPDMPGVCRHEERVDATMSPKECLLAILDDNGFGINTAAMDGVWDDFVELMAENGHIIVKMDSVELKPKNSEEIQEKVTEANNECTSADADKPMNYEKPPVSADKKAKFYVGQKVSIQEISNSHDWVFERKVGDGRDGHEAIIYVSRDKCMMVSFYDDCDGTIMLNRPSCKFDKLNNDEYNFLNNKPVEEVKKNHCFIVGQVVNIDEIEKSDKWKLKSFALSPFDPSCTYVTIDGGLQVRFADGKSGVIIPHYPAEQWQAGQRVHVGAIGMSPEWMYAGEENDLVRYVSRNKMWTVTFRRDSDFGVIKLVK